MPLLSEQCDADGFGGPFRNRLPATMAIQVRGGVAGVDGIHLDGRVSAIRN